MGTTIVLACLFLMGAVYNLISGNFAEGTAGFVISLALCYLALAMTRRDDSADEFVEWLEENRDSITTGQALYQGVPITPATELTRYEVCVSFLIFSLRYPSAYLVRGHHNTLGYWAAANLVTLMGGWWALPMGPVNTVRVLAVNLRGGNAQTVEQLLDELAQETDVGPA